MGTGRRRWPVRWVSAREEEEEEVEVGMGAFGRFSWVVARWWMWLGRRKVGVFLFRNDGVTRLDNMLTKSRIRCLSPPWLPGPTKTPPGDVLSVLLQGKTSDPSSSKIKLRLVHLDVQDGSIIQAMDVRVVDVDVDVDVGDAAGVDPTGRRRRRKQDGVAMRWWKTEAEWPADEVGFRRDENGADNGELIPDGGGVARARVGSLLQNGSGGMIMDSIPKPTPVAPFTSLA
jgi:hypothetical protein